MAKGSKSGGKGGLKGARDLSVRVKSARGRKPSSTRWLQRQLNDPYVAAAQREGYRSRAAYKLLEIDDKLHFLKPGRCVVDLGATPGGWSQVASKRIRAEQGEGNLVAIDINEMDVVQGAKFLQCDFMDEEAPAQIRELIGSGAVDVVLSDMAAPATGHKQTDHLRIMGLCEAALDFAREILTPNGVFIAKVLSGGTEHTLLVDMKRDFKVVRHIKPKASRADSAEMYVVASGYRGSQEITD
jgi:23S rRNA (uridine2552-2'-O)-methyltransferase